MTWLQRPVRVVGFELALSVSLGSGLAESRLLLQSTAPSHQALVLRGSKPHTFSQYVNTLVPSLIDGSVGLTGKQAEVPTCSLLCRVEWTRTGWVCQHGGN